MTGTSFQGVRAALRCWLGAGPEVGFRDLDRGGDDGRDGLAPQEAVAVLDDRGHGLVQSLVNRDAGCRLRNVGDRRFRRKRRGERHFERVAQRLAQGFRIAITLRDLLERSERRP